MRRVNHLRPGIKRGNISADEEDLIVRLHKLLGNSTEFQHVQMKEWQVAMVENYWRGSPIIAAVDPFQPDIDGEVAFNALSSFLNIIED
ncbi:transcription factor MYB11 isoform X2 [Prunus yedoensis var. nudiflora]|uniref:Transcription factor MYB11 isoform X2 n=1 Tax=Prunus yedoensis var. nudiflora TaxID=2094558 RepID=A0A314YRF7_PRUYE|nr:transcription factor MYB11 isoform X2 [Prunus yedoensis var. nudiflora]